MAASPTSRERPPGQGFRRSFTLPTRPLSLHEKAALDQTDANAEVLYSHHQARIVTFSPPTDSIKSSSTAEIQKDTDYPVDTIETLPWRSRTEIPAAAGNMLIEKVRGSTYFLKCQDITHAILRNSQCWCVDGESKFVLRVRKFQYYRIELPSTTEDDKKKVEELKTVLPTVLRYERTPCPFVRAFHVDLPDDAITPRRKGQWKRRDSSQPGTPEQETPPPRLSSGTRSWSMRTPPSAYPKHGPSYIAPNSGERPGSSTGFIRRHSLLGDQRRPRSPVDLHSSADLDGPDRQDSERDSNEEDNTDDSDEKDPTRGRQTSITDKEGRSLSVSARVAAFETVRAESRTRPTPIRDISRARNLRLESPVEARESTHRLPQATAGDHQEPVDTIPQRFPGASSSKELLQAEASPSTIKSEVVGETPSEEISPHQEISTQISNTDTDVESSFTETKYEHQIPENDEGELQQATMSDLADTQTSPTKQNEGDAAYKDIIPVPAVNNANDARLSTLIQPAIDGSAAPLLHNGHAEDVMGTGTNRSSTPLTLKATQGNYDDGDGDLAEKDSSEIAIHTAANAMSHENRDFRTQAAKEHSTMPETSVWNQDKSDIVPDAPTSIDQDMELQSSEKAANATTEDPEDNLSTVSSVDSFHTLASEVLQPHPTGTMDFAQKVSAEEDNSISSPTYQHKRDSSEITVTDSSLSDLFTFDAETPLARSVHDWQETSEDSKLSPQDAESEMRQRFVSRRSSSPLPPASTLFTGTHTSPWQDTSHHMTKAILQKAIIKPIEVMVLVIHILSRIAGGATVNDLLSGELFRKPEHRRRVSGFADQSNPVISDEDDGEDDYGVPIREGRTVSRQVDGQMGKSQTELIGKADDARSSSVD